jgi:ubiquinone/menaquinone biosynthesis C-methylase UbiE
LRTLHHIQRPELAVAELVRVTRPRGRVLVVDQIAPVDPVAAAELNAFERTRDPSHTRALADIDLRQLFESNELVLLRAEYERERRELDSYLDLAGCEGEARARAEGLAPRPYVVELGWYLLER